MFSAPGWTGSIWRCFNIIATRVEQDELVWDRYDIDVLRLSHTAALLLQQGLPTGDLFPPDGFLFMPTSRREPPPSGPFLFLAGRPVLSDPPPRVEEVTLGHVLRAPRDMKPEQLLGQLVETTLCAR
jgi:hypothetical protein